MNQVIRGKKLLPDKKEVIKQLPWKKFVFPDPFAPTDKRTK